jgi:hypothetical protein
MKLLAILMLATLPVLSEETKLFNGTDLSGWQFSTPEAKAAWSAMDGVISCTGEPTGFIRTEASHENYTLTFDWRWSGEKVGNSGLLIHAGEIPEGKAWPVSIEAQLESGNAGDFWSIGSKIEATGTNTGIRWQRIADPKEKTPGEWNTMTVVCVGDTISVTINGVLVNEGKSASVSAGAIGFQSEGTPIEFRNIALHRE